MYISIDLGGTKTRVASSKNLKDIYQETIFDTKQDIKDEKKELAQAIASVSSGEKIEGVCVGIPGLLDQENKKFGIIPNIRALSNLNFDEFVGKEISENIIFENDAALAGLGEAVHGAGKNHSVVAYLTLSTGVGGSRIIDRQIDPSQKHAEPGEMIIRDLDENIARSKKQGTLQYYTGGTHFEKAYGVSSVECKDQTIWDLYAKNLSLGIINVVALWSPDVIVLGGSIMKKYTDYFEKPLSLELAKEEFFKIPPIIKSKLEDNSGLVGGFVLMLQEFDL